MRAGARFTAGHPPAAARRRGSGLAGPRGRRRGGDDRPPAVGDRSRAVPRPRPGDPGTGGDGRRSGPVRHDRRGARPDREPAATGAGAGWRDGARGLLDPGGNVARRGPRSRREVSRPGHLRPGGNPGVDAGPGPAAPPRHDTRRGAPLPGAGQPRPVLGPDPPAAGGRARAPDGRARRAVGARDLGRSADRAGADRRARGRRPGAAAAPCPRVLAHEAARRRPGDPQRAGSRPTSRISRCRWRRCCGRASRPGLTRPRARAATSTSCGPTV